MFSNRKDLLNRVSFKLYCVRFWTCALHFYPGTPKKTPIRIRKFTTPLPANPDMTPTSMLAKTKPTPNMTPARLPTSPASQLSMEPERLPFSPQAKLSMKLSREGSVHDHRHLPRNATPSPGLRSACVSLRREFESAGTPVRIATGSTPGVPVDGRPSRSVTGSTEGLLVDSVPPRSSANKLNVKTTNPRRSTTPGHSNKSEGVSVVSVVQYSPYVLVNAVQGRQQAGNSLLATPGVFSQVVASKNFSTPAENLLDALQQSVRKRDLKPRFLTPYPKGAWLPVTEGRTEESETTGAGESPRTISSSKELRSNVSTLGLSSVNPKPPTPTTPAVKVICT